MMDQYNLAGRTALVTGAGVGIGRAVALALSAAGATVGIHYHASKSEAEATLAAIHSQGGAGILLPADLTVEQEATATVERLLSETGRLDIVVNNAGSPLERARQSSRRNNGAAGWRCAGQAADLRHVGRRVTKLRLKPPSKTEPRHSERILLAGR